MVADALPLLSPLVTSRAADARADRGDAGDRSASTCRWRLRLVGRAESARSTTEPTMAAWLLPIVGRQNGARLLAEALRKDRAPSRRGEAGPSGVDSAAGQADPALMAVLNKAIGITAGSSQYNPQRVERAGRRGPRVGRRQSGPRSLSVETGQLHGLSSSGGAGGIRRARSVGRRLGRAAAADHRIAFSGPIGR